MAEQESTMFFPGGTSYLGGLEVEIRRPSRGYFKGFALDVVENFVIARFDGDWAPHQAVPLTDVRLPDPNLAFGDDIGQVEIGSKLEVFSRAKENEPGGWWLVIALQQKGNFFIVQYVEVESHVNEIVSSDRLRRPNTNKSLKEIPLYRCIVQLPDDVDPAVYDASLHGDFFSACQAQSLIVDSASGCLALLSTNKGMVKRAELLAQRHVENLSTKIRLKQRSVPRQERHDPSDEARRRQWKERGYVEEVFTIPEQLMRLAIGARGANIQSCKKMNGIVDIQIDQPNTICIVGESNEALQSARNQMEFCEERFTVPKEVAGLVIGSKRSNLRDIAKKSNVHRIEPLPVTPPADAILLIVGRKDEVQRACALLKEVVQRTFVFEETFMVADELLGLVIGKRGENMRSCRRMPGVRNIEINGNSIKIQGDSSEAVSAARDQMEFCQEELLIAENAASRVIGRQGRIIQQVLNESEATSITVEDDLSGNVAFTFVGLREQAAKARILVEYQLHAIEERDSLGSESAEQPFDQQDQRARQRRYRRFYRQSPSQREFSEEEEEPERRPREASNPRRTSQHDRLDEQKPARSQRRRR